MNKDGGTQSTNHYDSTDRSNTLKNFSWLHAFIILLIITIVIFGNVLFSNDRVLSKEGLDLFSGEMYGRDFEFLELKKGNFPLWNPHVFSGIPFFDGIQSTILYPPNFLHLIFPLPQAINIGIALHVFLIGFFMYLWAAHRHLHPLACILSAVLIMFSGTYFMHIYPGHLANLCAMTWVPLIFLSIDGLSDSPSLGWCLLGIFAVTMQILAGQPQYVYYTCLAVGIYSSLCLIKATRRDLYITGLMAILVGSLLICSVQILSAIQAAQEGLRSSGVTYNFASMFSFPPENYLTILSPFFFGDMASLPYWGRCYLWEMSLFIGVTGFFLAFYGSLYSQKDNRRYSTIMVFVLLLLALGAHTPLYNLLYYYLPGFDKFRSASKFNFQASLFLIMLAGIGMDSLIRQDRVPRNFILTIVATGTIVIWTASLISIYPNVWSQLMQAVAATGESYLSPRAYVDSSFIENAGRFASLTLLISGITCIVLAIFFRDKKVYFVTAIAFVEIFIFAGINRPTFDIQKTMMNDFKNFYSEHPGDYRVVSRYIPNMAASTGAKDIWGYGPVALKRYAQFMAFTQGQNPDEVTTYLRLNHCHRLFSMIRLRYIISLDDDRFLFQEMRDIMPRLNLVQERKLIPGRDNIFKEMDKASFDPRQLVILETPPYPEPVKSKKIGYCTIVDSSTNHLTIKAHLTSSSLLLITDPYSVGWHAKALPGSIQNTYSVLPANYALMAIPLSSGDHIFRVEYLPLTFSIGKWISLVSASIYFVVLAFYWHRYRQKSK